MSSLSAWTRRLGALVLLLLASQACSGDPVSLFPTTVGWNLVRPSETAAVLSTPHDPAFRGKQVIQIDITRPTNPIWNVELTRPLSQPVKIGDRLRYSFWARGTNANPVRVVVEKDASPWTGLISSRIVLTPDWRPYSIDVRVDDVPPGRLAARLQLGEREGQIAFAQIDVQDLGPDPAVAAAAKALDPAATAARIRKYRMGSLQVTVLDAAGRPLARAPILIAQTRHAFLFGCNFFGLNPDDNSAPEVAYRTRYAALLNYATLPFYWSAFEPRRGAPDYPRLSKMAAWCADHNIATKGHPLVWHMAYPEWGPQLAADAYTTLHHRVYGIIEHYKGSIHRWDVVNEANSAAGSTPPNGESRWVERDGAPAVVESVLDWVRDAGRGADETFIYNDFDTGPGNVGTLQQMQRDGKLPDAIGIQSHMHQGVWPLTKVWLVCQSFSQFHRPLHFTEVTVLSGPIRADIAPNGPYPTDWNSTAKDEQAQADYVAQFYTLLFSHPSVQAITWWDFSDLGAWMNAPSGLVHKDMTPKPAYDRLMELIHHVWWTDVAGRTSSHGRYEARVFYGAYTVSVRDTKGRLYTKKVWFPEGSGALRTTIRTGR